VNSNKATKLLRKLSDKEYRDAYMSAHTRRFLAQQMRSLRGDLSQAEMGVLLGKPQSVVSRLEDPTYGKLTISTALEIAAKTNRALLVQFVDPKTFAEFAVDVSEKAQSPVQFDASTVDEAIIEIESEARGSSQASIVFKIIGGSKDSADVPPIFPETEWDAINSPIIAANDRDYVKNIQERTHAGF
jgi:hypothetical protein